LTQQKSDFGGFYSLKGQGLLWQQKYTLPIADVITFLYYIGAAFQLNCPLLAL